MSLSKAIANQHPQISGAVLEKVILQNDLTNLSPLEKVQYVNGICNTLGLNPVTQPIALMKFNGKEVPYFKKDATEQLRKINNVSIKKLDTVMHEGIYIVTAYAMLPNGREDSSTGVITISGLKGDNLSNAMMKAETKAKRRVTLSICGLGFIDESEVDSIPNAKKFDVMQPKNEPLLEEIVNDDLEESLLSIAQTNDIDELQEVFTIAYKKLISTKDKNAIQKLINAKDKKKSEIEMVKEFNAEIDVTTGEVLS